MEHSIEDSLNLDSEMGSMDFDQSDVVVTQEDITLDDNSQGNISMDMVHIEEQPTLMDTGEEVIISDFMDNQFSFQEYTVQGSSSNEGTIKIDQNQLNLLLAQNESFNLQMGDNSTTGSIVTTNTVVSAKAALTQAKPTVKKLTQYPLPRQVAIAPKPSQAPVQFAIAPKPVAIVVNKSAGTTKPVTLSNVQGGIKSGNTVLAQIGKQIVMMPSNAAPGQKIKVVPAGNADGSMQFAQIIANKGAKQVMTKLIVQGQGNQEGSNHPAVITKLPRYVMQQKTVPIAAGNRAKVIITTPTKQNIKLGKNQQIFAIKPQNPKASLVAPQAGNMTKRVVITSNSGQNIVMKAAVPKPVAQVVKEPATTQGQVTQLHQINVPGKGVQYIKLVTNQSTAPKPKPKVAVPPKNFVFADSKGVYIQVAAEKVTGQQPAVMTGVLNSGTNKLQRKLVRIAPISSKAQGNMVSVRSSQSLLAPITTTSTATPVRETQSITESAVSIEEFNEMVEQSNRSQEINYKTEPADDVPEPMAKEETVEEILPDRPTLQSLISDAVGDNQESLKVDNLQTFECSMETNATVNKESVSFMMDETGDFSRDESNHNISKPEDSIIIVPASNYGDQSKEDSMYSEDVQQMEDSKNFYMNMNVEAEVVPFNMSPDSASRHNDSELVSTDLGLRPRKACNCTKSQCLKLYCDCFANGEFCNNCNCDNCHNNLENEELRQKAIRACLERNPNAFRPKIGKSKTGGPEIIRRHNKGCNCKRSGCLKNYCECYEAKIACTAMCKCVGCRNVEETLERRRAAPAPDAFRPPPAEHHKQPCSFMTLDVISAVCQCLVAAAAAAGAGAREPDPAHDVLDEFARCLQDIIGASHQAL